MMQRLIIDEWRNEDLLLDALLQQQQRHRPVVEPVLRQANVASWGGAGRRPTVHTPTTVATISLEFDDADHYVLTRSEPNPLEVVEIRRDSNRLWVTDARGVAREEPLEQAVYDPAQFFPLSNPAAALPMPPDDVRGNALTYRVRERLPSHAIHDHMGLPGVDIIRVELDQLGLWVGLTALVEDQRAAHYQVRFRKP